MTAGRRLANSWWRRRLGDDDCDVIVWQPVVTPSTMHSLGLSLHALCVLMRIWSAPWNMERTSVWSTTFEQSSEWYRISAGSLSSSGLLGTTQPGTNDDGDHDPDRSHSKTTICRPPEAAEEEEKKGAEEEEERGST